MFFWATTETVLLSHVSGINTFSRLSKQTYLSCNVLHMNISEKWKASCTFEMKRNLSKQQNLNLEGIQDNIYNIFYANKLNFNLSIHI